MPKYNLNVLERLTLLGLLPKEGNFATLKILRGLVDTLGISDEEYKEFEMKQEEGQVAWNKEKDKGKLIELGEAGKDICVEALRKLDKEEKLGYVHYSLYEKFVEEKEGKE